MSLRGIRLVAQDNHGVARSTEAARNRRRVRARRDFEALRQRRMQAADMLRRGKRQVDVAVKLGVSQPTASRWRRAWLGGGREAVAGAGRGGRARQLSDGQLAAGEGGVFGGPQGGGGSTPEWDPP